MKHRDAPVAIVGMMTRSSQYLVDALAGDDAVDAAERLRVSELSEVIRLVFLNWNLLETK